MDDALMPGDVLARLADFRRFADAGRLRTTEPLLPLVFSLKGEPYSLADHRPFAPLFRTRLPKRTIIKAARQTSKSTSLASAGILFANCVPHVTLLYVTPLYEQVRRFSTNYVADLINQSPVKALWSDASTNNSVLQRTFKNHSKMIFSFATLSPDRTRGIPTDVCSFDEIQDADLDFLPIIEESMSHSPWGVARYSGTPKTTDGPVEVYWQESSQAEWIVPCPHCTEGGRPTENVPSLEYHLDAMVGPARDDVGPDRPGTICHRCRQPIFPRLGRWVHRYPERRWDLAGYHVPQAIMPLHHDDPEKWAALVAKRESLAPHVAHNELDGESHDTGAKLVTLGDLKSAATLTLVNPRRFEVDDVDPDLARRLGHYRMLVLGVDWGGGRRVMGKPEVSFTTLALVGLAADMTLELLWGARLHTPHDHAREADQIRRAVRAFGPHLLAHDFTGAGIFRETCLVQAGLPLSRIMAMELGRSAAKDPVRHVPPSLVLNRSYYQVDKARTMLYTIGCLKQGLLRTFAYDHVSKDEPGLLHDFLALVDEQSNPGAAGEVYMIRRQAGASDDFAWAVNFACTALWHANDAWPMFVDVAAAQLRPEHLGAGPGLPELEDDFVMGGYFRAP